MYFQKRNCVLSPDFYIHVSVSDLYLPKIGPHIFLQQNRQSHGEEYRKKFQFIMEQRSFTLFERESAAETFLQDKNQSIEHILCSRTNNGAALVHDSETSFAKAGKFHPKPEFLNF